MQVSNEFIHLDDENMLLKPLTASSLRSPGFLGGEITKNERLYMFKCDSHKKESCFKHSNITSIRLQAPPLPPYPPFQICYNCHMFAFRLNI